MRKKGLLTVTEKKVVKNSKTNLILGLVLIISIVINCLYATGIMDRIM